MYPPIQLFLSDEREFRLILAALRQCQDSLPSSDKFNSIVKETPTSDEFRVLANKILTQPCGITFISEASDLN